MMGRGRRGVEEGVVNFRGAELSENGFNYEFYKSLNDVYKSGNVVSAFTSSRTGNDGFFEASRYWVSIPQAFSILWVCLEIRISFFRRSTCRPV